MFSTAKYRELKKEKEMSLMYQSPAFAGSSRPNHYGYQLANNMAMDQPGFNQFVGAVAPPPMMQNQNTENQFGSDVNNGDNYNPNQNTENQFGYDFNNGGHFNLM